MQMCSIADNNLGGETDYVKASEVEGDSKVKGAKVMYQGREMVVSKNVDDDGDLKMIDLSGMIALADALKTNSTLTSLKCACLEPSQVSAPLHIIWPCDHLRVLPASPLTHAPSWCHSLQSNELDDSAKQQLQEAAGGRISLQL